jgi:hypothetical protein
MPQTHSGSAQPRAALRPVTADAIPPLRAPRLLDQVRETDRYLHYSRPTEQAYLHRCKAFIRFHGLRHPRDLGASEVEAFLNWLADERQLATSTHKQALSALIFPYSKVLQVSLSWVEQLERPRVRRRLPVVLSRDQMVCILARMQGEHALLARLLYGAAMRISEALQLRVKDVDFSDQALIVREGKGGKDRVLMLGQSLAQPLRDQLGRTRLLWAEDAAQQRGGVELPHALERKDPACWCELALVLGVPARPSLDRSAQRSRAPPSPVRPDLPASVQTRRFARQHRQTRHTSHAAPLLRDALAARRIRHPHSSGPARTRRRGNDHDLHTRIEDGRRRCAQPVRRAGCSRATSSGP